MLLLLTIGAAPASGQSVDIDDLCARASDATTARACWKIDVGDKVGKWGGLGAALTALGLSLVAAKTKSDTAIVGSIIAAMASPSLSLVGAGMERDGYAALARRQWSAGTGGVGVAYTVSW